MLVMPGLDDRISDYGDRMSNTGCEQFPEGSHVRNACEGATDMRLDQVNRLRERVGAQPITEEERAPRVSSKEKPQSKPLPDRQRAIPLDASGARLPKGERRRKSGGCSGCGGKKTPLKPNGYGPGSQLLAILEADGVPHCEDCVGLAAQMDTWGKSGCAVKINAIVADVLPRAVVWVGANKPWTSRLLTVTGLKTVSLELAIKRKVMQAIEMAADPPVKAAPRRNKRMATGWRAAFKPAPGVPTFKTIQDLAADTWALVPQIPGNVTEIIGVSRSGVAPATILAMALHLPLSILRQGSNDLVPASNGWRLKAGPPRKDGTVLVVDDTTMTGTSLEHARNILKRVRREKIHAAVYCNPAAATKPDLWAVDLPWPHLLEWNLFNSVLLGGLATDFDGILCEDCLPEEDDDGPKYERFLRETKPHYMIRKEPIKLIVTARTEKYRGLTMEWLAKWGLRVERLEMRKNRMQNVIDFKARHYKKFLHSNKRGIKPRLFIESDPRQAEAIAKASGGLVVCPAAARCYQ